MTRASVGARFRQRKLSTKQQLQVVRENQIDTIDETDAQRNIPTIETGVEHAEEVEHHLQAAINASQAAVLSGKAQQIIIPTPNVEQIKSAERDALYPKRFSQPTSYIRFSSTVEDCCGCPYSMGEEEAKFLQQFNTGKRIKCSEDTFEWTMYHFESVVAAKQPYLALDPSQIMPYEEFEAAFDDDTMEEMRDTSVKLYAKAIYPYWKELRVKNEGKPLMPQLKFEQGTDKDDGDPYVCFRRREVRQARKTRRSDTQSTEKLLRLRQEIADARTLLENVVKREIARKQSLEMDCLIFETRQKLKESKRMLGIRGDDEDLVNLKPPKKRPVETSVPSQRPGQIQRIVDQRAPENDLVRYEDVLAQRKAKLGAHIEEKLTVRARHNVGFEDFTEEPYQPPKTLDVPSAFFQPAELVHLPTPSPTPSPGSSPRESSPLGFHKLDTIMEEAPALASSPEPTIRYRRRVGRGGRIIIDRRMARRVATPEDVDEVIKDRFKFDHSDEEENPVYELNPYSEELLRFRARLLAGPLGESNTHHTHLVHQQVAANARRQQQIAEKMANGTIPTTIITTH